MDTLFISDLDGTLVNNRAEISDFSLQTLQALVDDGLPFTIASARSIVSMQQMLKGLRLNLPVISFNGGYISDLDSGRHHLVNSIESDVIHQIYDALADFECVPYLSTYTGNEERVYYHRVINPGMEWYLQERITRKDPRFRKTDDLRHGLKEQVVCMTVIHRQEIICNLEQHILDSHGDRVEVHQYENQYDPGWYWLTVHDSRASKDQAIEDLKKNFGLEGKRTVVFGDNRNDISMFKNADHAVAVANAQPEARQYAHEVIGSNEQDAVARYLADKWRKRPL
jgi:Cof subfamily protein (haloacid dehalogenase superfamily)